MEKQSSPDATAPSADTKNQKPLFSVSSRLKDVVSFYERKTVGKIKEHLLQTFQRDWEHNLFGAAHILRCENILVYKYDKRAKSMEQLGDQILITGGRLYAVEFFDVAPMDLYRTVAARQLFPWVPIDPDSDRQHLTKRIPLYTAAMTGTETAFPFVSSKNGGVTVEVHGVSLRMKGNDEVPLQDTVDAFRLVGESEKVGVKTITLEQLNEHVNTRDLERHEAAGLLFTGLSHENIKDAFPVAKTLSFRYTSNRNIEKDRANKGLANDRNVYFRFVVEKGTNLLELGVGLVFDKNDHWTMVRMGETKPAEWTLWTRFTSPGLRSLSSSFLPDTDDPRVDALVSAANNPESLKDCLRGILAPKEGQEPETVDASICAKRYIVFPKVAAKAFTPTDLMLKASAEPKPLENPRDQDSQEQLHSAALVLYHTSPSYDALLAIEELEAADYISEHVDDFARSVLLDAMNEALSEVVDDGVFDGLRELLGWSPEECQDVLGEGVVVLERGSLLRSVTWELPASSNAEATTTSDETHPNLKTPALLRQGATTPSPLHQTQGEKDSPESTSTVSHDTLESEPTPIFSGVGKGSSSSDETEHQASRFGL